jgi:hypothetical protein
MPSGACYYDKSVRVRGAVLTTLRYMHLAVNLHVFSAESPLDPGSTTGVMAKECWNKLEFPTSCYSTLFPFQRDASNDSTCWSCVGPKGLVTIVATRHDIPTISIDWRSEETES